MYPGGHKTRHYEPLLVHFFLRSAYSLPDRVGTDDLLIFLSHKLFAESVLISSKKALFTAVGKSIKKISPPVTKVTSQR